MRLLTREQAQQVDQQAQRQYDMSSGHLMESAGQAVLAEIKTKDCHSAVAVVGRGHNGADAWVVARMLKESGIADVKVLTMVASSKASEIWNKKRKSAIDAGVEEIAIHSTEQIPPDFKAPLLIDGLYGTGLDRKLDGQDLKLIEWMNSLKAKRISIDVASGLDCNTGEIWGDCVKADLTITFGLAKPGLYLNYGPRYSGKIKIHSIGFPQPLLKKYGDTTFAVGLKTASQWIPSRPNVSNKATFGRVVLFAGSTKYRGAGLLAATAALRAGAGYVHLISDDNAYPEVLQLPEVIYQQEKNLPWKDFGDETCYVVGPGYPFGSRLLRTIEKLKQIGAKKVILDAEALNELARVKAPSLPSTWLMTPHPGELARLEEESIEAIVKDRLRAVIAASQRWGCQVLLKGFRTVVGNSKKQVIVLAGNSSLAKAGSGDVLAGIIGALAAQGLDTLRAGILGASLHGTIANQWIRSGKDPASLIPQDLLHELPILLRQAREHKLALLAEEKTLVESRQAANEISWTEGRAKLKTDL